MAVIVPTGRIKLCNVPFDNSYEHQLTFPDITTQQTYFGSKIVHSLVEAGYTYIQKENYVRVPLNADLLYNANYLMYQNTSFGTKWFYAFITRIEWLSDASAAVYFETDVWQTWYFDINIKPSFVLREHDYYDYLNANTIPENVQLGDYVETDVLPAGLSTPVDGNVIMVMTTITGFTDDEPIYASGAFNFRTYSGSALIAYDTDIAGISALNTFLNSLTEKGYPDAVIAMYLCPKSMITTTGTQSGVNTKTLYVTKTNPGTLDGYTPKNNKLYTSPYMFAYVHNANGSAASYPIEDFASRQVKFRISGNITPNPSFKLVPDGVYKKSSNQYDHALSISGYPLCSWSYDAYKAWLAQNGSSQAISTLGSVVSLGIGAATMNPLALVGGALSVAQSVAQMEETKIQPPQAKGNALSGAANTSMNINDFFIGFKTLKAEYAKCIDDYFSMYGYKTNRVKIPNITGRPNWNYVQTAGFNATGLVPAPDMVKIKQMFNKGVTFWHSGVNVGNYALANAGAGIE